MCDRARTAGQLWCEHRRRTRRSQRLYRDLPLNFPLAISSGQVADALAPGNVLIATPSEQTGLIGGRAVRLMHEVGIPGNVLQFLPRARDIGAKLVADQRIVDVAFTGALAERDGPSIPIIAETGGRNTVIVASSALTEQVVADAIRCGFHSALYHATRQRPGATPRRCRWKKMNRRITRPPSPPEPRRLNQIEVETSGNQESPGRSSLLPHGAILGAASRPCARQCAGLSPGGRRSLEIFGFNKRGPRHQSRPSQIRRFSLRDQFASRARNSPCDSVTRLTI